MGYSMDGHCYVDAYQAHGFFQNKYPQLGAEAVTSLVSSSVNATGLITYSLKTDNLNGTTVTINAGTVQMNSCVYQDVTLGADYGFPMFIGCALMFALGFIGTR